MPATVAHALSATTPDNPAFEIKPSNWNSNHVVSLNIAGSEIVGAFSNANGVSFGLSNGQVTASVVPAIGGGGVAISAGGSSASSGTIQFLNSNGFTWGLLNGALTATFTPGAAAGIAAMQLSNTTYTSGTVNFINANGISWGSSGANGISASFNVPNAINASIVGNTAGAPALVSTGTLFLSGAANITLNQVGNSIGISAAAGAAANSLTGLALGANTTQATSATLALTAFNVSAAGIISAGFSNGTLFISSPASTGISQSVFALGNTTQGSSGTQNLGVLSIVGAGGLSVGFSNGSVVLSGATGGGGGGGGGVNFGLSTGGNTAGATGTVSTGNVILVGLGAISLSQATGAAGSAATVSILAPAVSSISGTGQLSVNVAGSTINLGVPIQSVFAIGNTTQGTSGTLTAGSLLINALGGLSVGFSNGSLVMSGGAGGGGSPLSLGVSNIGNTAGNTGTQSGQAVFVGGNNITLSIATAAGGAQTITISGANLGGAQTGISGIIAGTQTQTVGTLSFVNSNGITWGMSNSSLLTASYNSTQFAGTGTTISGNISATLNSNGLQINASNLGATGFATTTSAGLVIAGTHNTAGFTLGVPPYITTQSNQNNSLFALGNTTQNSSTVLGAAALSFNGLGAMSVGFSNGSIQLSAPATSSISATGGLSISVNASTILIGQAALSRSIWPAANVQPISAPGMGSVSIQYLPLDNALSASRLDALVGWTAATAATTATMGIALSVWAAIYTKNGLTLSSLSSGSTQTTYTYASNSAGNTQLSVGAIRPVSVPVNMSLTQGEYYVGFNFSTAATSIGASTTNLAQVLSMYGGNGIQSASNYAEFTAATNTSTNLYGGMGVFTAATAGMPASIALSNINQAGQSLSQANIALAFRNV